MAEKNERIRLAALLTDHIPKITGYRFFLTMTVLTLSSSERVLPYHETRVSRGTFQSLEQLRFQPCSFPTLAIAAESSLRVASGLNSAGSPPSGWTSSAQAAFLLRLLSKLVGSMRALNRAPVIKKE